MRWWLLLSLVLALASCQTPVPTPADDAYHPALNTLSVGGSEIWSCSVYDPKARIAFYVSFGASNGSFYNQIALWNTAAQSSALFSWPSDECQANITSLGLKFGNSPAPSFSLGPDPTVSPPSLSPGFLFFSIEFAVLQGKLVLAATFSASGSTLNLTTYIRLLDQITPIFPLQNVSVPGNGSFNWLSMYPAARFDGSLINTTANGSVLVPFFALGNCHHYWGAAVSFNWAALTDATDNTSAICFEFSWGTSGFLELVAPEMVTNYAPQQFAAQWQLNATSTLKANNPIFSLGFQPASAPAPNSQPWAAPQLLSGTASSVWIQPSHGTGASPFQGMAIFPSVSGKKGRG